MGYGSSSEEIQYSEKYYDAVFEYRHVIVPNDIARIIPRTHLLTETEWRNLGIQQSPGWVHYMTHQPEPHILLFRRLHHGKTGPEWDAITHVQNVDSRNASTAGWNISCKPQGS